jgi:hypothetical protein
VPLYRLVEAIAVGALVAGSALWLLGALAPGAVAAARLWAAVGMNRRGRPRWMRALAGKVAPVPAASAAACGSGCSSCSGCPLTRSESGSVALRVL